MWSNIILGLTCSVTGATHAIKIMTLALIFGRLTCQSMGKYYIYIIIYAGEISRKSRSFGWLPVIFSELGKYNTKNGTTGNARSFGIKEMTTQMHNHS